MKDDRIYLRHILDCIKRTESYISGVNFNQFTQNDMMIAAIIRELEVIGEACNHLSENFRSKHDNINGRRLLLCGITLSMSILGLILKLSGQQLKKICQS